MPITLGETIVESLTIARISRTLPTVDPSAGSSDSICGGNVSRTKDLGAEGSPLSPRELTTTKVTSFFPSVSGTFVTKFPLASSIFARITISPLT